MQLAKAGIVAVLSLLLVWQVGHVQDQRRQAKHPPIPAAIGDSIPQKIVVALLTGLGPGTRLRELTNEGCWLLYFFDPACPACVTGARAWRNVDLEAERPFLRLAWVSLSTSADSTVHFITRHAIQSPVYQILGGATISSVGVGAIPGVFGIRDGTIAYRSTGVSATSPLAVLRDVGWCRIAPNVAGP